MNTLKSLSSKIDYLENKLLNLKSIKFGATEFEKLINGIVTTTEENCYIANINYSGETSNVFQFLINLKATEICKVNIKIYAGNFLISNITKSLAVGDNTIFDMQQFLVVDSTQIKICYSLVESVVSPPVLESVKLFSWGEQLSAETMNANIKAYSNADNYIITIVYDNKLYYKIGEIANLNAINFDDFVYLCEAVSAEPIIFNNGYYIARQDTLGNIYLIKDFNATQEVSVCDNATNFCLLANDDGFNVLYISSSNIYYKLITIADDEVSLSAYNSLNLFDGVAKKLVSCSAGYIIVYTKFGANYLLVPLVSKTFAEPAKFIVGLNFNLV